MSNENIEFLKIAVDSDFYKQAVELRYNIFFKPSQVSMDAVYDSDENISEHFVVILENKVVGYSRLTVKGEIAQFSQLVADPQYTKKYNIGGKLITNTIEYAKKTGAKKLVGNIRMHMQKISKYFGFTVLDEVFPSKKTGIPHKRIEMDL